MQMPKHGKTVDNGVHLYRRTIQLHPIELTKHLLSVHRIFILDLKTVCHQQITSRRRKLSHQLSSRLPSILQQSGLRRERLHAHGIVEIDAHHSVIGVDEGLALFLHWKGKRQYQSHDEKATQEKRDQVFQRFCQQYYGAFLCIALLCLLVELVRNHL